MKLLVSNSKGDRPNGAASSTSLNLDQLALDDASSQPAEGRLASLVSNYLKLKKLHAAQALAEIEAEEDNAWDDHQNRADDDGYNTSNSADEEEMAAELPPAVEKTPTTSAGRAPSHTIVITNELSSSSHRLSEMAPIRRVVNEESHPNAWSRQVSPAERPATLLPKWKNDDDVKIVQMKKSLYDPNFQKRAPRLFGVEENASPDSNSSVALGPYAIIVGSVAGVICLSLILIFVIIKTRRRKATSPLTPEPPKQASLTCPPLRVELNPIHPQVYTAPHLKVPEVFASPPQPIRIKAKGLLERRGSNASLTIDLNAHDTISCATPPKECSAEEYLTSAGNRMTRKQLKTCLKDMKMLAQEFHDIPLNHPPKPDIPGSSNKNRYRSIFPNEISRVLLPVVGNDLNTSYINANYMRGYDGEPQMYIATQGPMAHTIKDFWRMVFTEKSPCVVMMTKLKERNKIKCEQYLPTKEETYGDIHVFVRSTTAKNGYYVRDIILKHEPTGELQQIKHYWFTAWPDHKAPVSTAKQLIELAQEVESERHRRQSRTNGAAVNKVGPTVVHCSAGIGRTGCFIGTSIAMKQLEEENAVDILGIVCQMRMDRGGMIQTPEQYEFLHHALVLFEKTLPETPTSAGLPASSGSNSSNRSHHSHSNSSSKNNSQQTSPVF